LITKHTSASHMMFLRTLHWFKITESIECTLMSLT